MAIGRLPAACTTGEYFGFFGEVNEVLSLLTRDWTVFGLMERTWNPANVSGFISGFRPSAGSQMSGGLPAKTCVPALSESMMSRTPDETLPSVNLPSTWIPFRRSLMTAADA